MREYIGIDLGTTNSVISTYNSDHNHLTIHESQERNNVTPSAIFFTGQRMFIGWNAYVRAPGSSGSSALEFKRRMGENTPIELPAVNRTLTPEECSSEILKELRNYLPEELRTSEETGTVVTVPAAFDQKATYATRQAAEMAGIGKVELIQEPVAAVMSFIHYAPKTEGIFLIYDLGGGTFDAAIAESSARKKVSLLTHSGIEVCGGSDFDRLIVENIVLPRLHEKYDLPDILSRENGFYTLYNALKFSAEQAKIELSRSEDATIEFPHPMMWTPEVEEDLQDLKGNEVRLNQDIVLKRSDFDKLITDKVDDTVNSARKAMTESGVNSQDIEFIVWIGGPTHYKPLRDKVTLELGIKGDMLSMTQMNPMTAVSEGASIFAESIDWSKGDGKIKRSREQISSKDLSFSFNYDARISSNSAKIAVQVKEQVPSAYKFEVISGQSSWESGRIPLEHGAVVDVQLEEAGENMFKVVVYDDVGKPISIEQDEIIITKTPATLDVNPCSHSIALEVLDRLSGTPTLEYIVKKNDPLPRTGTVKLKANEQLAAGTDNSLIFKVRSGEFEDNIKANDHIGDFTIHGTDLPEDEVIPADGDLICEYEIKTSDEIKVEVSVPDIGIVLEQIYSPTKGKVNYKHKDEKKKIIEKSFEVNDRIDEIKKVVTDSRLDKAKQKLELANTLDPDESNPDKVKEAKQGIKQAEELIEVVSRKNRKQISQIALTKELTFFDMYCRQHARASEETEFDKLVETAQRAIENNDHDFNKHLNELKARIFEVLWWQPFFIIERFKNIRKTASVYASDSQINALIHKGEQLLGQDLIVRYEKLPPAEKYKTAIIDDGTVEELREIVRQLMLKSPNAVASTNTEDVVNIFRAS